MNFQGIRASLVLLAIGSSINVLAQTPSSGLPQDPMALMSLAHDRNGLSGSDIKPWHIRGTYHSFDMKGSLEYEGTYEEWWVSATRYKLSFRSPRSTQTDYATGTSASARRFPRMARRCGTPDARESPSTPA